MPAGLLATLLLLLPLLAAFACCSKQKKPPANPNEVLPPAKAAGKSAPGTPGSAEKKAANDAVDVEP